MVLFMLTRFRPYEPGNPTARLGLSGIRIENHDFKVSVSYGADRSLAQPAHPEL